jgi:hypothetical protein
VRHNPVLQSFLAASLGLLAAPALADDDRQPPAPPPVFQAVVDCRALTDAAARLACFDRTVEAMATASSASELAVFDRTTMHEARRGIFGLGLPRLRLFNSSQSEEVNEIDGTISAIRSSGDGFPIFVLEDGARWKQTEGRNLFPRAGNPIHIRRAAMGSYMANVAGQPAVRVIRLGN